MVEDLVLRRLYTIGTSSLKALSQTLKLSYSVIQEIFERLRKEQFFEVKGMQGRDYTITLSEKGQEFARKSYDICRYVGPAPVSLKTYRNAVMAQTGNVKVNRFSLKPHFTDLVLTDKLLDQLGPALNSQNSIFLYGPTGNGKTSLASRLARIYEDMIAVPYAVEFDGQIVVVYDPVFHERVDTEAQALDPRWVLCRRPCVIVGGELTPNMLELKMDENTGVYAAPLQMKANNGMLVIDDFGRQILSPEYLLNRWIVPLDRRVDYLSLTYGVKFEIPFEMTVVFSTNLDPTKLADEAFLRRIQNKIYVGPVDSEVFDKIFNRILENKGFESEADSPMFLRKLCTEFADRELRACYPSDIISIIVSISAFEEIPVVISKANLKRAADIYFTQTLTLPNGSE
jgi:predicted transcriptional regulator/energy-coupling factor transporter ATP-binding protein EcfA2